MNRYKTSDVAKRVGVHPNTVRMYEDLKFITKPNRRENGHREFTERHMIQMQFARLALRGELLQKGLRKKAIQMIKLCGACEFEAAIEATQQYRAMLEQEIQHAKEAIQVVTDILENLALNNTVYPDSHFEFESAVHSDIHSAVTSSADSSATPPILYRRQETADLLGVTIDTLRNWELNGLMRIMRKSNGYRVYREEDLRRLKIIRTLRCANYSLSSILRLMNQLFKDEDEAEASEMNVEINSEMNGEMNVEIAAVLDTPQAEDDVISACDRLLTSLERTLQDTDEMLQILSNLINEPVI